MWRAGPGVTGGVDSAARLAFLGDRQNLCVKHLRANNCELCESRLRATFDAAVGPCPSGGPAHQGSDSGGACDRYAGPAPEDDQAVAAVPRVPEPMAQASTPSATSIQAAR